MPSRTITPAEAAGELSDHLEFLSEVGEARNDLSKLGNAFEELCTHHRALGICLLSGDGDTEGFFRHLIQSAITRRHYLQAFQTGRVTEIHHARASFLDPLFDAMAAGQWKLAGDLTRLASPRWLEGEEYEEDYCYAALVHRLLAGPEAEARSILERWETVLEGGKDSRLAIAEGLAGRDAAAFAAGLEETLESVEARAAAALDPVNGSLLADEATFYPNRWVSVEGLALLALARRRGMEVSGDFTACPRLARDASCTAFVSQGYPHIDFEIE